MAKVDHGAAEAARHGVKRSARWPRVEREFRASHPCCLACVLDAPANAIQVHHIHPFHYVVAVGRPDLELDERNLVSLCETEKDKPAPNHHLLLGHLGDFREGNLDVMVDAATNFHGMTEAEIRGDGRWWKEASGGRLKSLDLMSEEERSAFRLMLDEKFPISPTS